MAANQITIEVLDEQVRRSLERLQAASGDLSPALNIVGRTVRDRIRMGFKSSRSPYGDAWTPLKIREGQPLRDTGRLQSSITYRVGGTGSDQYVDVGTNVMYAPVHQFGATIKPKTAKWLRFMGSNGFVFSKQVVVPARPFMPLQADQLVLPQSWSLAVLKAMKRHFERVETV